MAWMHRRTVLVIAFGALLARVAGAQQAHSSIAMSAGSATDISGVSSSAVTLVPSLSISTAQQVASVGAVGTLFSNHAWSAGLNAAFSARGGAAAIAPTIDLSASAATTSYSLSYGLADVTPALEGRFGDFRVFGGAHLSGARSLAPSNHRFHSSAASLRRPARRRRMVGSRGSPAPG
jgi:hypothetical protein